ncbi:hypothetical protein RR47_GL001229 [Enterococcus columbae DSM 7374 = ATCC 51263]|nr:hypothetical protein RR47_GL001229 [Enterococcus columbae DSM 7374 = ATCC 51263]
MCNIEAMKKSKKSIQDGHKFLQYLAIHPSLKMTKQRIFARKIPRKNEKNGTIKQ